MNNQLIVDLSKAKPGDVAVFRHGGRIPIGYIESKDVESYDGVNTAYFLRVGADIHSEVIGWFSRNGINERHPYDNAYCEIIFVDETK